MMSNFVDDHISFCKVATGLKLSVHVVEEREVEIDLVVARAIKRAHGALRKAAGRLHFAPEENERRCLILLAGGAKQFRPRILGIGKVVKRPVYDSTGQFRPADLLYLSFSFDHRVLDGAIGAAFGNAVIAQLQNPAALLLPERFAGG